MRAEHSFPDNCGSSRRLRLLRSLASLRDVMGYQHSWSLQRALDKLFPTWLKFADGLSEQVLPLLFFLFPIMNGFPWHCKYSPHLAGITSSNNTLRRIRCSAPLAANILLR